MEEDACLYRVIVPNEIVLAKFRYITDAMNYQENHKATVIQWYSLFQKEWLPYDRVSVEEL